MFSCMMCGCESKCEVKCEVCGATREKAYNSPVMDKLTKRYTAFDNFNEFAQSMANGYVPSLYRIGRGNHTALKQFVAAIRAAGYRVYDGQVK